MAEKPILLLAPSSFFWGGITAGRLLAIPLAVRFSADLLVRVNLVGGLLSSALLWFFGRVSMRAGDEGAGRVRKTVPRQSKRSKLPMPTQGSAVFFGS